jgi:pimeloyl-ACP methyl ester carboxylesterase
MVATIERGENRIHYQVEGAGAALVLHTGGGGDLRMWRMAGYTRLLAGRRLVLMDHRGHGASSHPQEIEQHSVDAYVEDVIAVADDLGVEKFSFFGYSSGAAVGYRLAATRPERIAALVGLGAVGAKSETTADGLELATLVRNEGMKALVPSLREAEPDLPEWFADQMLSTDPEMFALQLEAWAMWGGPWEEFSRIEAPTLIVVGQWEEGPSGIAAENARLAASVVPNGRWAVLPELGHCMAFVRSDSVVPHVSAFLAEP